MIDPITEARLAKWKDITAHAIALLLTIGFFSIALLALVGVVRITDPTTATFVGTVTGYAIAQLTRPLMWYFEVRPLESPSKSGGGA